MGLCRDCIYYRRVKPASQLLAQTTGTLDAEITKALLKIQDDENQQKGLEAQARMNKALSGTEAWDAEPVMSEFCGKKEGDGVFLIAEIKNRGAKCDDYVLRPPPSNSCIRCAYRIVPEGVAKDIEMEKSFSALSAQNVAAEVSSSKSDSLLNRYREGAASRKAFELSGAYSAKGVMATMPDYLDYCAKFSNTDEFVICTLRNPHNTCSSWKDAAGPKTEAAEPKTDIVKQQQPNKIPDETESEPQESISHLSVAENQQEHAGFPTLQNKPEPIRDGSAEGFCKIIEYSLNMKLSEDTKDLVNDIVQKPETHDDGYQMFMSCVKDDLLPILPDILALDVSGRASERETPTVQEQDTAQEQEATSDRTAFLEILQPLVNYNSVRISHLAEVLLEQYNQTNTILSSGNPPLTRGNAECFVELFNFMKAIGDRVELQPLTTREKNLWISKLISNYPHLTNDQRQEIAEATDRWIMLQDKWDAYTDDEKSHLREKWVNQLESIAALEPPPFPVEKQEDQVEFPILQNRSGPIRDDSAEGYCSYIELALNMKLSEDTKDLVNDIFQTPEQHSAAVNVLMIATNSNDYQRFIKYAKLLADDLPQILALSLSGRAATRKKNQLAILKTLHDQKFLIGSRIVHLAEVLLEQYDNANTILSSGNPPLTRGNAECFIEMFNFQKAVADRVELQPLTTREKNLWISKLITNYPHLTNDQRQIISEATDLWIMMQDKWDAWTNDEKSKYRERWVNGIFQLTALGPPQFPVLQRQPSNMESVDVEGSATETNVGNVEKDYDSTTLQRMITEAQKAGDSKKVAELMAKLQKKLQEEEVIETMADNIFKQQHEMAMKRADNLR